MIKKKGCVLICIILLLLFASPVSSLVFPSDLEYKNLFEVGDLITYKESPSSFQVYVFDKETSGTILISETSDGKTGNSFSDSASISSNGIIAVFNSWSTNFVSNVKVCSNVYVKTVTTKGIEKIKDHALSPEISGNGEYVVYEHISDVKTDLPAIYRYEVSSGKEEFVDYTSYGNTNGGWYMPNPHINYDGSVITYHTTKRGSVEVWEWNNGKTKYIKNGIVTDVVINDDISEMRQ